MDATVSSLDKVRDAIHVMALCPGLGRIQFITPSWEQNNFADVTIDSINNDDKGVDMQLEAACKGLNSSFRAVETSELMMKTVMGLPQTNTFSKPLIGTCPNCEGDDDEYDASGQPMGIEHASGHARVCWDPGAALDTLNRRTNCESGVAKVVLCVDAHDSVWTNTNWADISSYSHSSSYGHSYRHAIETGNLSKYAR